MKSIYFHLIGGAAGDMLLSSLIELGCPLKHLRKEFKKLRTNFDILTLNRSVGHTRATFLDYKGAADLSYLEIVALIKRSKLSGLVKERSLKVYETLYLLEKKIHNVSSADFKFHHLGQTDAILEITGFFIALEYLKIKQFYVSTFPFDRPAPVTLRILKNKKIAPVDFNYETITPTGAVLLSDAIQAEKEFIPIKEGRGWGMCAEHDYLVAYLFEDETNALFQRDSIIKIETNIDDMNPQAFESLFEALYEAKAKEVFIENVVMKKSRPAFVLNVLCTKDTFPKIRELIFSHTTTFGIRYQQYVRDKLAFTFIKKKTKFGLVTYRTSREPFKKEIPEYSDCLKIARKNKISLLEVYKNV